MQQEQNSEQSIIIHQRQRAHLDDIGEVESFTESEIVALSSLGRIWIEGAELHIDVFNAQTGVLEIHGQIDGIQYLDDQNTKGTKPGFFARFLH